MMLPAVKANPRTSSHGRIVLEELCGRSAGVASDVCAPTSQAVMRLCATNAHATVAINAAQPKPRSSLDALACEPGSHANKRPDATQTTRLITAIIRT